MAPASQDSAGGKTFTEGISIGQLFSLRRHLRATAHKYGPNNGTSRKIDFAHFLPKDWP